MLHSDPGQPSILLVERGVLHFNNDIALRQLCFIDLGDFRRLSLVACHIRTLASNHKNDWRRNATGLPCGGRLTLLLQRLNENDRWIGETLTALEISVAIMAEPTQLKPQASA